MAARLTFHYTLSTVLILAVLAGALYLDVSESLERRKESYLVDEIYVLQAMLGDPYSEGELRLEFSQEQVRRRLKQYVRLLAAGGTTLLSTPGMEALVPVSVFPPPTDDAMKQRHQIWRDSSGRSFSLKSLRVQSSGFSGRGRTLQIAMDVTSLESFLHNFRLKLAAVLVAGALVSAVAGWLVARRGLLPLSRMTRTVQKITVNRLNERIVPQHWPNNPTAFERILPEQWPSDLTAFACAFDSMLDRLEDSFTGLSHYTANLAHELRTPINNLMMEADIALSRARAPEEYQRVLESNMEEYRRLSHMIDSLLFLARADNAQSSFLPEPIEVARELEEIAEYYSAVASDEGVQVTCLGRAHLLGDPVLIRRALSNLLSNALKFTPHGGEVVLSARQAEDGSVTVEVRDNGCGIAAEHLPQIFDRFFRVPSTRQMSPHGSGLGLSIVKAIMELHGGRVDVRSQPGWGTSVLLSFPMSADAPFSRPALSQ